MIEHAMTFSDLVATYSLARSEGVVLRYLTDAWRTLKHSVPTEYVTEQLEDVVAWLGELIRQVDSSLIDEWAQMSDEDTPISREDLERELAFGVEDPTAVTANRRAFTVMVRNHFYRLVELFAFEREEKLETMTEYLEDAPDWPSLLDDYFNEYDDLDTGQASRGKEYFLLQAEGRQWQVRQILKDPEGDNAFSFVGTVDLDASDEAGEVRLSELRVTQN
jgi:superfamily II RNA helicase